MGRQAVWIVASVALACIAFVQASDPQLTSDFAVPDGVNPNSLDGSYFYTSFANFTPTSPDFVSITKVDLENLPSLQGLGVSTAILRFPPGAVNPPHTHPRGTELLSVLEGSLEVGLIDTTNKLYTLSLNRGASFVFPIGLVHFQINSGPNNTIAFSSFSSSAPGTVRLPDSLFKSNAPADVLAKSFGVDSSIIAQLVAATVT